MEGGRKFLEVESVPQMNQEDHEDQGESRCRRSKKLKVRSWVRGKMVVIRSQVCKEEAVTA